MSSGWYRKPITPSRTLQKTEFGLTKFSLIPTGTLRHGLRYVAESVAFEISGVRVPEWGVLQTGQTLTSPIRFPIGS